VGEQAGAPNPYQPPRAATEAESETADITRLELRAFAGQGGDYYWWRWTRSGQRNRLWLSWNWPAAIFSLLWFSYRKMWREFLVIMLSDLAWGVVESMVATWLGRETLLGIWLDMLLYSVVLGLLGNFLYVRRARLEVGEARRKFPDDQARQTAQLSSVGGTSWWWVLAGLGLSVAAGVLQGTLTSTLAGWLF
jgi:hypothetical protein